MHDRKAVAAIVFGIISLLCSIGLFQIFVVTLVIAGSIGWAFTILIIPIIFLVIGLTMTIYSKVKGCKKHFSITGIILNSIASIVVIAHLVLIVIVAI